MAGSVNKVILIGNVGADPEIRSFDNGDRVANFSLATSESWKDKVTGEKKERTEWHRIAVINQGIIKVIENYVQKGTKIYVEGVLQTRKWQQDGVDKYVTEVVLKNYSGSLTLLSSRNSGPPPAENAESYGQNSAAGPTSSPPPTDDLEDEIPF